jgi:hypothetical protein
MALVTSLRAAVTRRYPMYWATHRASIADAARQLIEQRQAWTIDTAGADEFLGDLVERLQRLDQVGRHRGRPVVMRSHSLLPRSNPPVDGWRFTPLLQLCAYAVFNVSSPDDCDIFRGEHRAKLEATLQGSPLTPRLRGIGSLQPDSVPDPTVARQRSVGFEVPERWVPTPEVRVFGQHASYRLGGDAERGVSALARVDVAGQPQNNLVVVKLDIGISVAVPLALGEVVRIFRDDLPLITSDIPDALSEMLPPDTTLHRVELFVAAWSQNDRSNSLPERLDLRELGTVPQGLGEILGFAARLPGPLSRREAGELALQAIDYMVNNAGFLDPREGLERVRKEVGATP